MSEPRRRSYAPVSPNLSARRNKVDPLDLSPLQQPYYPGGQSTFQQTDSYLSASNIPLQSPYQPPYQSAYLPPPLPLENNSMQVMEDDEMEREYHPSKPTQPEPARRGRKPKIMPEHHSLPEEPVEDAKPYPGQAEGIIVKNKFPTARIKRIMQADEDVGKVAQVTPTAVNKALELFIVDFVLKSVEVAKARGQKKVTTQHMKQVVNSEERFDWCKDFVGKIPDIPEKKNVTGDEAEPVQGAKRKRAPAGSRRVKSKDSDDD